MQSIALVIHVILAVVVIGLVLMQHGKGADAGAAFGSGASATVFGARGATSFLTRMTTVVATLFFLTSVFLFWLAAHREGNVRSVTDTPGLVEDAPVVPAPADPANGVSGDLPGGVPEAGGASVLPAAPADPAVPAAPAAPASAPDATSGAAPAEPGAGQALPASDEPAPAAPTATPAAPSAAPAAPAASPDTAPAADPDVAPAAD